MLPAPPVRERRRIVPTLIAGPEALPARPPPMAPSEQENLLARQTQLLGAGLVYKIQSGKATPEDFEERVAYLNALGGGEMWTVDKLIERTGVKTEVDMPQRLRDVINRWENLALAEDKEIQEMGEDRYDKIAKLVLPSRRTARRPVRRTDARFVQALQNLEVDPSVEYTIAELRMMADSKGISLRGRRRKAEIEDAIAEYFFPGPFDEQRSIPRSRSRTLSKSRSRSINDYRQRCMQRTVRESREVAKRNRVPLGRDVRTKAKICDRLATLSL